MPIQFGNTHVNNYAPAVTIEETFKFYGAWSNIQDYDFDAIFEHLGSLGWVAATATASYSATGVALNASGLGAGWYFAEQNTAMPTSFRATYLKAVNRQGLWIGLPDGDQFIAATDSSGYPLILKNISNTWTAVQSVPVASPQTADVIVAFRQLQFTSNADEFWRSISIYMNDALITTYMEPSTTALDGNLYIGVAAYGGDTAQTYSNLRVGELTMFAEYGTIDAGANPIAGLQLTTDGLNIKSRVRFDGSLRAHRVKAVNSVKTIPVDAEDSVRPTTDFRELKSHIRMMGAYTWAEVYDRTIADIVGHRFVQTDNPMLMSEQECYDEALRVVKRMQESAYGAEAESVGVPLIEVEDRITLSENAPDFNPDNDWIVNEINLSIDMASMQQQLSLRKYVWGS